MASTKRAVLHPVLKTALASVAEGLRPQVQAGGPAVRVTKFEGPACLSLAVWQTGLLASTLENSERKQFDTLMAMAADAPQATYRQMERAPLTTGSPALRSASNCVAARRAAAGGYDSHAASNALEVTNHVLTLLGNDSAKVTRFLVELDDRLMAYELAAAARLKGGAEFAKFERVLWRGADAKGDCTVWVARVSTDVYAILSKVGARWRWVEGSFDDTLAAVPDAHFAAATKTALARDLPLKVSVRLPVRGKDTDNFWTVDFVDRT